MFEYHCWIATPVESLRGAFSQSTVGGLQDHLASIDPYSAIDVATRNGLLMVSISGFPNHAGQKQQARRCAEEVLGLSEQCHGLFMYHDDESVEFGNEYRVSWIARGAFGAETRLDGLSPVAPTVYDP